MLTSPIARVARRPHGRRLLPAVTASLVMAVVVLPVGPSSAPRPRIDHEITALGDLGAPESAGAHARAAGHDEEAHAGASASAPRRAVALDGAQMVAFDWDAGDARELRVRVHTPAGWGDWIDLAHNPDESADHGTPERRVTPGVGPLWVGAEADRVEVVVPHGELEGLRLHELTSIEARPSPFAVPSAAATAPQPAIRPRSAWGADESIRNSPAGCEGGPAYAHNVMLAFVHHTVTANGYAANEADDLIRGIYQFHVKGRGYCDIGYNFLVDRYGQIWEGRAGGIGRGVIGAHAGGFNSYSTGVALLGDHSSAGVTAAARQGVSDLLTWKLSHHGVDPAGWVTVTSKGSSRYASGTNVNLRTISGHRDVSSTACPGNHAYGLVNGIRSEVSRRVIETEPYPLAGYRPAARSAEPPLLAVDAWGGLAPRGSAAPLDGPYWYGWQAVGRAVIGTSPQGGYLVDAWGGVHPLGDAPAARNVAWFPGQDVVRGAAPGGRPGDGFVLDAFGGVHPFGTGQLVGRQRTWGWDIARGIAALPDGRGGYVLDGWGGVHPFGVAPALPVSGYWTGWDITRDLALLPSGRGGYVLDGWGGLHPFGTAPKLRISHYTPGRDVHVGIVLNSTGRGGWVLDREGQLWPFGDAAPVRQPRTTVNLPIFRDATLLPPVSAEPSDEEPTVLP